MQKLQLYIGTDRIDLFKDESVSFNQTIQNVRDIAKIFTEFTKTFTLPASQINNKIFKHYYNFDITSNTNFTVSGFDARNKVSGRIELNTIPFKTGFIKLEGVELQNNKPYAYKITFFGNTVNLKDTLGERELSTLNFAQYNLPYDYTNIDSKLQGTLGTIIAPLITHTQRLIYSTASGSVAAGNLYYNNATDANGVLFSDLKYALRLYDIILAIESEFPTIDFSTDFFSTSNPTFYNLYLWLHRKKGSVEPTVQVSLAYKSIPNFTRTTGSQTTMINGVLSIFPEDIQYGDMLQTDLTFIPTTNDPYSVRVLSGSQTFFEASNLTGTKIFGKQDMGTMGTGFYTVQVAAANSVTFASGNIRWALTGQASSISPASWVDEYISSAQIVTTTTFQFNISEQIPKIKIIDFLTGIFKTFNLTAYVDTLGVIVVRTLDSYYAASSTVYALDKYLDVTKSEVNVALPFKQIEFRFKGLGTFLAKQYEQLNNVGWGTLKYSLDDETFDGPNKVYNVIAPFEHVMYERLFQAGTVTPTTIQYGYFVDDNQQPYYGEPLIFYAIRQTSGTPISLKESASSNHSITNYIIPSNSRVLDPSVSTENLNFGEEVNEYTALTNEASSFFAGSLFLQYYVDYISSVFSSKRRFTKVNAYLPLRIIYNLELNDKISLGEQVYKINSIQTDLTDGKSSIELLNNV